MSEWVNIGSLSDIPRQGARRVEIAERIIAVFRAADDTVFALDDQCPHKGGPLSQGIVHGHSVTCPLHSWVINLATGKVEGPDEGCTGTIGTKTEDGHVYLQLG